jgi:putative FmdB family regulatory protein
MPIYDYVCTACGRRDEVWHGINESGPDTCGTCGGRMRKALSPPAIHFKGSGWAKVDARSRGAGPLAPKEGEAGPKAGDSATRDGGAGGDAGEAGKAPPEAAGAGPSVSALPSTSASQGATSKRTTTTPGAG